MEISYSRVNDILKDKDTQYKCIYCNLDEMDERAMNIDYHYTIVFQERENPNKKMGVQVVFDYHVGSEVFYDYIDNSGDDEFAEILPVKEERKISYRVLK
jgi:hypothetical protein